MIILHHLNNSRSQRILWLLEEIGCDYEIKHYQRDAETMRAPDTLRAVHPLGKSPVISDGDVVVAESGAIIEYLVDTYAPQLRPEPGSAAHRDYRYWMHFAEGSLMPPLLVKLLGDRISQAKVPFFVKPIVKGISKQLETSYSGPETAQLLDFINRQLAGQAWICGDELTGADFQLSFPLEAAGSRLPGFNSHTNITRYLERIHARPAYQRALGKGGEYAYA